MRPALAVRQGRRSEGSGLPTDVDTLLSPSCVVEPVPLEVERGVDVAAIRALLRLSPAERVDHMVEVVKAIQAIRDHARAARS